MIQCILPYLGSLQQLGSIAADIGILHVNANCTGRIWTICEPDFGTFELKGKLLVMVLALCGMRAVRKVLIGGRTIAAHKPVVLVQS